MDGAGAKAAEGGKMGSGAVTFVSSKIITGVLAVKINHELIASDFGDN